MKPTYQLEGTQAQVVNAIVQVREAISLAERQELRHYEKADDPCAADHLADDAAVRGALLNSEEAMISVLEALPPQSRKPLEN